MDPQEQFPQDARYTDQHEWVRRTGEDTVRFGVTAHAAEALGDVVLVVLPAPGDQLSAGEPCGTIESHKAFSDLFAPVSGEVVAVNEDLLDTPERVNESPYDAAWMVDVRCPSSQDLGAALAALMDAATYRAALEG